MKIRFSLRSFFILFTIAIIVCGCRYNQRKNLQLAATELQKHGAAVFYHWESPYIVKIPMHVSNPYLTVEVPYTETLPNGERVTKHKTEIAGRNTGFTIISEEYYRGFTGNPKVRISEPPGFSLLAFFLGSHDDVDVAGVSIPAAAVDEKVVKLLRRLNNLETMILGVDRLYYSVQGSTRRTPEQIKKDQLELGRDLERATKLLEEGFPGVKLHRRGITPEGDARWVS